MTIVDIAKSHQGLLETVIHRLFPGEKVLVNSRKETELRNPGTGAFLELDVWLPSHNICFEFQDAYHYITTWYSQTSLTQIQEVDSHKRDSLKQRGQSIVIIPCWWDGSNKSLAATVAFSRPDVFPHEDDTALIALNPPAGFFDAEAENKIPDVGELMLASFPPFQFHQSLSTSNSWWLGEKYDGIRFCWNPIQYKIYRRLGTEIELPVYFKNKFGQHFLDGEIWFGKDSYVDAQRLVRFDMSLNWSNLKCVIFDTPAPEMCNSTFEKRYESIFSVIPSDHPFLVCAGRAQCNNKKFLTKAMKEILKDKGEGIILRKSGSIYLHGRSSDLFKYKAVRSDAEALVVDVDQRNIFLQLPNGRIVEADLHKSKEKELKAGDVVTYYHESSPQTTSSKPRVLRVRADLAWGDVVREFRKAVENHSSGWDGRWSKARVGRERKQEANEFFHEFARKNRFDPLQVHPWYLSYRKLQSAPEIKTILAPFKGSLIRALLHVFPNIGLDPTYFSSTPQRYWQDPENRRKFLDAFARTRRLDPLLPSTWVSLQSALSKNKTAASFLGYYKGIGNALKHLYPDVPLNSDMFRSFLPQFFWKSIDNRRHFFVKFAENKKIGDPLIPETWYPVTADMIRKVKHGRAVLHYYKESYPKALSDVFPENVFDMHKFRSVPKGYWNDLENRKSFVLNIAKERGFDALVAENWYSLSLTALKAHKGMASFLALYEGRFDLMLLSLFPQTPFDCSRLAACFSQTSWQKQAQRRTFFEEFAREHKFDPLLPYNWYHIPISLIRVHKHSNSVRNYYNGNIKKALLDLFPEIGLDITQFVSRN